VILSLGSCLSLPPQIQPWFGATCCVHPLRQGAEAASICRIFPSFPLYGLWRRYLDQQPINPVKIFPTHVEIAVVAFVKCKLCKIRCFFLLFCFYILFYNFCCIASHKTPNRISETRIGSGKGNGLKIANLSGTQKQRQRTRLGVGNDAKLWHCL